MIASYHGELSVLRRVATLGIHLVWNVREGSQEKDTVGKRKPVGWRGKRLQWWELQVGRWGGALCVGRLEKAGLCGKNREGQDEAWWVLQGELGKDKGSSFSFYSFVSDVFIWFPSFPMFTISLEDTGMASFKITLNTWDERPLNVPPFCQIGCRVNAHMSFLSCMPAIKENAVHNKDNVVLVLEKQFFLFRYLLLPKVGKKGSQMALHRWDTPGSHQVLTLVGTLAPHSLLRTKLPLNESSSVFKLQEA